MPNKRILHDEKQMLELHISNRWYTFAETRSLSLRLNNVPLLALYARSQGSLVQLHIWTLDVGAHPVRVAHTLDFSD